METSGKRDTFMAGYSMTQHTHKAIVFNVICHLSNVYDVICHMQLICILVREVT